ASRNVNIFAIVSTVVLAANIADLWRLFSPEQMSEGEKDRKKKTSISEPAVSPSLLLPFTHPSVGNIAITIPLILWIGLIVTSVWGRRFGENKVFGLGERPWWFAHEAVQFAGQPGFPDRAIISHIGIAAVYEFHHGPEKKVLMDP